MMLTGDVENRAGQAGSRWDDVLWLGVREMRRRWLAYIVSASYLLGLGLLLSLGGAPEPGSFAAEFVILIILMILTEPFMSRDYMSWSNDLVAAHLTFLRTLPIEPRTIVQSRMLALVIAGVLNVPAFFVPIYLLGDWTMGFGHYLCFVFTLTGLSLIGTGVGLCLELGTTLRRYVLVNCVLLVILTVTIILPGWQFDFWIIEWIARITDTNGPLVAVASIAIGIVAYVLLGRLAERLLLRRELGA